MDGTYPSDALATRFDAALAHARELLPAQGPIGNFVHHNTLHAYQHWPFHEALASAAAMHDAQTYMPEEQYRAALSAGVVSSDDLNYAIAARRPQRHERCGPLQRQDVERAVLEYALPVFDADTDSDADALLFRAAVQIAPPAAAAGAALLPRLGRDRTMRDVLLELGARDPSQLSNPVLIDFLNAYLDDGMARWPMPDRQRGILQCFLAYIEVAPAALPSFLRNVLARLTAATLTHTPARTLCLSLLRELCVRADSLDDYVSRSLLVLPGWSGMVSRLETHAADREPGAAPASLCELSAVRLLLDIESFQECARELGYVGSARDFRAWAEVRLSQLPASHSNAHALYGVAKLCDLDALALASLGEDGARSVCGWLSELSADVRSSILHEAYERAHLRGILDPLARKLERRTPATSATTPRFQVMFCIDDREESIRRYFDELDPRHASYGVAGFFGVAMSFLGLDDAAASAQCPVVVTPGHHIQEAPLPASERASARRSSRRNLAARLRFEVADASRSLVRGAVLTPILGVLSSLALCARVLFPHTSSRVWRWLHARVLPAPSTQLLLTADSTSPPPTAAAVRRGFTVREQADRVATTLENVGATHNFARIVSLLGHGASTVNNPHQSAYDCGACGGRNGGPNARAFASMANSPLVRVLLRERGIEIPEDTWFIGGVHDTTTDEIRLFDVERVPASHVDDLVQLRAAYDHARAMSAYERCRKFEHAPKKLTPASALRHVEERAVDLSQARPELGHATNAVCVVGRRALTRDLFLDRRAFLVSYDASIDSEQQILQRVLAAVVPVGAGINLEYYFSSVDNNVWGSGTKLPHNLAGLLGVMEGGTGDLRTGLPRQMIEVHEPVRLLAIVEATPEAILHVAAHNAEVSELVVNEWVRVVSVHPETGALAVFERGAFQPYTPGDVELPVVPDATQWYRGKLGFLPPVLIAKEQGRAT
jgi:uncharacterized protein